MFKQAAAAAVRPYISLHNTLSPHSFPFHRSAHCSLSYPSVTSFPKYNSWRFVHLFRTLDVVDDSFTFETSTLDNSQHNAALYVCVCDDGKSLHIHVAAASFSLFQNEKLFLWIFFLPPFVRCTLPRCCYRCTAHASFQLFFYPCFIYFIVVVAVVVVLHNRRTVDGLHMNVYLCKWKIGSWTIECVSFSAPPFADDDQGIFGGIFCCCYVEMLGNCVCVGVCTVHACDIRAFTTNYRQR